MSFLLLMTFRKCNVTVTRSLTLSIPANSKLRRCCAAQTSLQCSVFCSESAQGQYPAVPVSSSFARFCADSQLLQWSAQSRSICTGNALAEILSVILEEEKRQHSCSTSYQALKAPRSALLGDICFAIMRRWIVRNIHKIWEQSFDPTHFVGSKIFKYFALCYKTLKRLPTRMIWMKNDSFMTQMAGSSLSLRYLANVSFIIIGVIFVDPSGN